MRIGELAQRAGVNPKTIRYYEDAGLMPSPPRSRSGYREFDGDALGRLRFIKAAQSVGLTLGEIREVLGFRERGETPCAHVVDLIDRHLRELADRIATLEAMRKDLARLSRQARQTSPNPSARYCHIIEIDSRLRA